MCVFFTDADFYSSAGCDISFRAANRAAKCRSPVRSPLSTVPSPLDMNQIIISHLYDVFTLCCALLKSRIQRLLLLKAKKIRDKNTGGMEGHLSLFTFSLPFPFPQSNWECPEAVWP